jgi:hypothetical protein
MQGLSGLSVLEEIHDRRYHHMTCFVCAPFAGGWLLGAILSMFMYFGVFMIIDDYFYC